MLKNLNKYNFFTALIGILFILIAGLFRSTIQTEDAQIEHEANHFKNEIAIVQEEVSQYLQDYLNQVDSNSFEGLLSGGVEAHRKLEEKGFGIYLFEDHNLKFWSSRRFTIPSDSIKLGFVSGENGIYYNAKLEQNGVVAIGRYLIKKGFRFENSYVTNSFQEALYLSSSWSISTSRLNDGFEILSNDKNSSVYIQPSPNFTAPINLTLLVIEIVGFLCLGLGILFLAFGKSIAFKVVVIAPLILIVRMLLWLYEWPVNLHELEIFQPHVLAFNKWIPSLGDLIINIYFVFIYSISLVRGLKFEKVGSTLKRISIQLGLLSVVYLMSWAGIETIEEMVMHSEIPLDLSNILSVELSTFIALFCFAGILGTYIIITWKFVEVVQQIGVSFHSFLLNLIVFYVVITSAFYLLETKDAFDLLWGFLVISLIAYSIFEKEKKLGFSLSISLLFIFSMMVTQSLQEYANEKEVEDRKQLLLKLAQDKDLIAEYLFDDIKGEIQKDKYLSDLIADLNSTDQDIYKYIKQTYFTGFWEKYDLQVNPCYSGDSIQLVNGNDKIDCSDFFSNIISSYGESISKDFHFLDNNNGRISYIGEISLLEGGKVFFEFDSKFKPDGLGFPILLLDKQIERRSMSSEYSFAMFKNGALSKQKGVYNFSTSLGYYLSPAQEWALIEKGGYDHLVLSRGENTYMLSKKKTGTWDQMAFYSYLFAFFSIVLVLGTIVYRLFYKLPLKLGGFKARFQGLIVFILFFSTVFIGIGSIYYLKNQYNEKNFDAISEKIQSVKIEVEHKLGKQDVLGSSDLEYIQLILEKFSSVFFTDINLYDPNGELISSSQPKIFDEGLAGRRMDPLAMYQMLYNSHSQFVQIEEIEGMQYLSAYVPFYNRKGDLLAYLNLPYFARSNDLKNEISDFLVALLNIYTLLIVIALVIALIITNKITEPLKIIQEKMAGIQLGKQNELIQYQGKDEIGKLINEYNRMVIAITESAQILAETEREDAWREMAKQVAHEIKNPLTPMKLSIQHLQMRWEGMSEEDRGERFSNFAKNLVEQIDTLSAIASEFSNFAKLEETNFTSIQLDSIIESSVDVYNGTNDVRVVQEGTRNVFINGDKDQMLRVFNNLIKNAIQAIPENREGRVRVFVSLENENVEVRISDNGNGISSEDSSKIFVPNFTTKNSGMGLGLAMVQKIIENMGGEITFQTEVGNGTEFLLIFPVFENVNQ